MPILLKDRDITLDIVMIRSALIVPCRFCPAANLAVREGKPYIELFRRFLKTASYESYIQALRSRLEGNGIRTELFDSRLPYHFIMCMWNSGRREDLSKISVGFDAVIVLGCDAAVETARCSIKSNKCRIIPGMEVEGIMNVIPVLQFPFNICLVVSSVTRLRQCPAGDVTRDRYEKDELKIS